MISFGGVRVWRNEWGDPTRLSFASLATAVSAGLFMKACSAGRLGWPGDALFADRVADPIKFHAILCAIGLVCLASAAVLVSTAWDLVIAARRDSRHL